MRYLLSTVAAIAVLAFAVPFASASVKTGPAPEVPIYVPSPPQHVTAACSEERIIATLDYWMQAGDTFTVRFEASGGPGRVTFATNAEATAILELPANSTPQWYALDLDPAIAEGATGLTQLRFYVQNTRACGPIRAHGTTIHVDSPNIFVEQGN